MIGLRQLINSVVQRLREQEANETQPVAQDLATPRQGLPRLLSEEDERASQAEGGDMWNVMHDEDGRRERLFRLENASACFRQPRARPTPGAHIGYQIAQRSTARVYCCAGCGAWLVRPQDLLSESEQAVDMSLDDSEFTICTESADVVEKHSYEVTADGVWCYQVGGLRCRGCDAFLGVKIKSVEKKHDPRVDAETSRTMYDIFNGLFRESRGVRISSPDQRWLRAVAPPPPPCAEVGGVTATAEAAAAAAVEAAEAAEAEAEASTLKAANRAAAAAAATSGSAARRRRRGRGRFHSRGASRSKKSLGNTTATRVRKEKQKEIDDGEDDSVRLSSSLSRSSVPIPTSVLDVAAPRSSSFVSVRKPLGFAHNIG